MYRTSSDLWHGLAKNAVEGLAAPAMIGPVTALLLGGQVLPIVLLLGSGWLGLSRGLVAVATVATLASYLSRGAAVRRFDQPVLGVVLHPLSVLALLTIQ
jgi:hypothetical protein